MPKSTLRQTMEAIADKMGYADDTYSRGTVGDKPGEWKPMLPKKKKESEFGYTERDKAAMEKAGVL